jgi:hypothetical protein
MAHLRAPDDNVTARFRQKPPNSRPATVHPGQPGPTPDTYYDDVRSAVQANIDEASAQARAQHDRGGKPTVAPQGNEPFMHYGATVTPVAHPGAK